MLRRGPGRRRAPLPQHGGGPRVHPVPDRTGQPSWGHPQARRRRGRRAGRGAGSAGPGHGVHIADADQGLVRSHLVQAPGGPSSTSAPNWLMSRPSLPLGPGRSRYRDTEWRCYGPWRSAP